MAIRIFKVQARRVHFTENADDFRCALLGRMGFSTQFIMRQTRLSQGQVSYRLRRARIKRSDYREGKLSITTGLIQSASQVSIPALLAHLKELGAVATTPQIPQTRAMHQLATSDASPHSASMAPLA